MDITIPDAPCMEYLPTFRPCLGIFVGYKLSYNWGAPPGRALTQIGMEHLTFIFCIWLSRSRSGWNIWFYILHMIVPLKIGMEHMTLYFAYDCPTQDGHRTYDSIFIYILHMIVPLKIGIEHMILYSSIFCIWLPHSRHLKIEDVPFLPRLMYQGLFPR